MTTHPVRPGFAAPEVASRADVLRRLDLAVTRRLEGRVSGDHATTHLGPGSERAGARAYEPGDDARLIDWNLTARAGETFVRRTEDERSIDTWIVVDRSASLDFGTIGSEKRDVVLAAAAAFGLVHLGGGNRVGLVVCGGERLVHRPARQGKPSFMAALALVHDTERQSAPPAEGATLAAALRWVSGAVRMRSRVVAVSDFLDADDWALHLRRLGLHHDVVAVHVSDPRELEMPDVGIVGVIDAETGRQRYVNTGSSALRSRYAAAAAERQAQAVALITASGAEFLPLSTSRDWLTDTVRFATARRGLRAAAGARTGALAARPVPSSARPGAPTTTARS
jgi:uncharacterized protein (DUF58 family)